MKRVPLLALIVAAAACREELPGTPQHVKPAPRPSRLAHVTPFVPRAEKHGVRIATPLVFPDGTRAVASHPRELKLPDLGVQPDVTYYYRRDPGARFALTFVHGGASPRGNEFAGEGGGAMLALGDGIPTPGTVASLDPLIEIAPVPRCRLQLQISGGYGSKCFGDLYVGVTGKPRFVRTFFAGFRIAERRRAALPRRN